MGQRTIVTGSREKGYIQYDDESILLIDNRGVYPHMGRAYGGDLLRDDGTKAPPKHGITILLKKGDPVDEKKKTLVERQINKLIQSKNNGNGIKDSMKCLRDGDAEGKEFMKGHWIISMSETEDRPPVLRGPNGEKYDRDTMGPTKIDNLMFGGCWYTPWFSLWTSDKKGFRVNASLKALQLVRKDEPLGSEGAISDDDADDVFGIEGGSGGFDPSDDEL